MKRIKEILKKRLITALQGNKRLALLSFCIVMNLSVFAQKDSFNLLPLITFDTAAIVASKSALDVEAFVELVVTDTTFYEAFQALRHLEHQITYNIKFMNKGGVVEAQQSGIKTQHNFDRCRVTTSEKLTTSGKFYSKKNQHNYFTAKMMDYLFFADDTLCATNSSVASGSKINKSVEQLKQLMFSPGKPIKGVPLIGKKLQIFSEKMSNHYHYNIKSNSDNVCSNCYLFSVEAKNMQNSKTIIKTMNTYFDATTFKILSRQYHLAYKSSLFAVNVSIDIQLQNIGAIDIPKTIAYKGFWKVVGKKKETAIFNMSFKQLP